MHGAAENQDCDLAREFCRSDTVGAARSYTPLVPEIANPQLRGAVDNLITQVTPENILDVRKVLLDEAAHLRETIRKHEQPGGFAPTGPGGTPEMGTPGSGFWVGRCSDDPISGPAALSFNTKIQKVVQNCKDYVSDLEAAGEQLAQIARGYGLTEDAIRTSFTQVAR